MAFGRRKASIYASQVTQSSSKSQKDYGSLHTGELRHQFVSGAVGGPLIAPSEYAYFTLCRFRRSFTGVADTPATPTQSNNYQTPDVMNGSRITRFKAVINVENIGAQGIYLDIYEVTASFWDVYLWNALFVGSCPLIFQTAAINAGEVFGKVIAPTLILENQIKGFKFLQHHIRKKGTIYVGPTGQDNSKAALTMSKIPAKCRRANSGMWWGMFLTNDSIKNAAGTANLTLSCEYDFLEQPSENRIPYLY